MEGNLMTYLQRLAAVASVLGLLILTPMSPASAEDQDVVLNVDTFGHIDADGTVWITGEAVCTGGGSVSFEINGTATQTRGPNVVTSWYELINIDMACDGVAEPFEFGFAGEDGTFRAGPISVVPFARLWTPEGSGDGYGPFTTTVKLRGGGSR
jgi:hypothetical protein